jgi:lipoate-protein ligase A
MNKTWRFINDNECDPYYNMALDESISIHVRKNASHPTLRIYSWNKSSVSLGYFQKINEIDYDYCKKNNIPIVRRLTGGKAIFHDKDVTYSISVNKKTEIFSSNLFESYKIIADIFYLSFLKSNLKVDIEQKRRKNNTQKSPHCFQTTSYAEIVYQGYKIIGSAQKRWSDGFLQQGCIPFSINKENLKHIFKSNIEFKNTIMTINEISPTISMEKLKENIVNSFEQILNIRFIIDKPTFEELRLTEDLIKNKYFNERWIYSR